MVKWKTGWIFIWEFMGSFSWEQDKGKFYLGIW